MNTQEKKVNALQIIADMVQVDMTNQGQNPANALVKVSPSVTNVDIRGVNGYVTLGVDQPTAIGLITNESNWGAFLVVFDRNEYKKRLKEAKEAK